MGKGQFWKKVRCKLFICCKLKISLNDIDGDNIPDEIKIKKCEDNICTKTAKSITRI